MNTRPLPVHFAQREKASKDRPFGRIREVLARIGTWLRVGADYHAAAGAYEQLSRLSDAELKRRGLSRDTLARDICAARERHGS